MTVALERDRHPERDLLGASRRQPTHLIFDVTGYFVPTISGATFVPLTPARLLDTRFGIGLSGPFHADVPRTFQVTGRGGVPAEATAVTGNLTVTARPRRASSSSAPTRSPTRRARR